MGTFCEACPINDPSCRPSKEVISTFTDQTYAQCLSDRVEKGLIPDALTGLDRIELFRWRLKSHYEHPFREAEVVTDPVTGKAKPLLALFIDGNGFGKANKKATHDAVDPAILALADALSQIIRKGDLKGRRGGDEFVTVSFGTSIEDSQNILQRAQNRLFRSTIYTVESEAGSIALNAGVVGVHMNDAATYDDALEALRIGDRELGVWKDGDRLELPPLITV
jgi:diguanylate cyclase (GGDEF)-like protein